MLLAPPRARSSAAERSKSACGVTSLTWREPAVGRPVTSPRHSALLLPLCIRLPLVGLLGWFCSLSFFLVLVLLGVSE